MITLISFTSDGLWEDLKANDCMSILKQELQKGNTLKACATAMVDLVCLILLSPEYVPFS